jgi:hypothetical protein
MPDSTIIIAFMAEPRPPRVPVKKGSIFFLWTASIRFESA